MPLECPTYETDQEFTCQPPENQQGWSEGDGCDLGCRVCADLPGEMLQKAVRVHGRRWLSPDESGQGRDAHGLYHDMRSGQPRQVPPLIDLLRHPCWKNDGTECPDADVCGCHPGEEGITEEHPKNCELGERIGELMLGLFPDCNAYIGYRIGANAHSPGGWMDCRMVHQHGVIRTKMTSGRIQQSMFHRFGDSRECVGTMMAECVGTVPASSCEMAYHWTQDPPPDFYHDNPCRQAWNFCLLAGNTAHLIENEALFPNQDKAILAAKNTVLDVIRDPATVFPDGRNLQQLDYFGVTFGNGWLDYWARGAGTPAAKDPQGGVPCDDPKMLVATTFPNSYLKNSRCPVMAELVVVSAYVEMSLVPLKVDWTAGPLDDPPERQIHPHARFRITARCGVRATLPNGECILIRPWIKEGDPGHSETLTIVNPPVGECIGFPTVSPAVDEIIYVDSEDRVLIPPLHVEWRGMKGAFSDPPTGDHLAGADNCWGNDTITARCLQLADALSGMQIPGWPAFTDKIPDDPNQIYGGTVTLDFRNSTYDNCCGKGKP